MKKQIEVSAKIKGRLCHAYDARLVDALNIFQERYKPAKNTVLTARLVFECENTGMIRRYLGHPAIKGRREFIETYEKQHQLFGENL